LINSLSTYIIYLSETTPFIFCIYFLRKNKSKDLKVFFVYTALLFISILAVLSCRYIFKSYNLYLLFYRFFIVGEFALISHFFALSIVNKKAKQAIRFAFIPFALFSLYDYISYTLSASGEFTYYPLVLECLLLPLIIIFFFYEKMKYTTQFPVYLSAGFWIAVGFLVFSSGNFFLFLFSKWLLQNKENKDLYNHIYDFFTILKNIFLCIGIVIFKNSKTQEDKTDININLEFDGFHSFHK